MSRQPAFAAPAPRIRYRRIGLPASLFALALAAALAALALWTRTLFAVEPPPAGTVEARIGGTTLVAPRAWIVPGARGGERLVLQASLRSLLDTDAVPADLEVGIALSPADGSTPPSDRPALLYGRFLAPGAETTADGLVRRAFVAGSPYEGETLFLAPPQGRAFAARCLDPPLSRDVRLPCLAEIRRAGVDAQIRLPREALGHWARIVAAVDRLATGAP